MAIPVEKLIIEIGGDPKGYRVALKAIRKENQGFEKTLKSAAVVGKAAFVGISASALSLGVIATKAFLDFETGLTNVAKTTNLQGEELEEFEKKIISLSEEIPVSTRELLEFATVAGQLGIQGGKDLANFTEVIAKLSKTSNIAGEEGAVAFARLLNLTNENTDAADNLASSLTVLGNEFKTNEAEILEIGTQVARSTVLYKLSAAEVLGLATAMAELGIKAEAGSTVVGKALAAIDVAIQEGTGPAFEELIRLTGLTGEQLQETFEKDASRVLGLFIEGLDETQKSTQGARQSLREMGLSGVRVDSVLLSLATKSDDLTNAVNRSKTAFVENTAANKEFSIQAATNASKLKIAQEKLNNVMIALGKDIAPDVIESIELLSDAVKSAKPLWKALGGTLKLVSKGMSNIIKTFSAGIELIKKGANSVKAFREQNEKEARDESKFLAKELKKRGVTWGKFSIFQREQRKKASKVRKKDVKKAEKEIIKVETDAQKEKQKNLRLAKAEKLRIETVSLTQIKELNQAEFVLAEARQNGASTKELEILQAKFDSIKSKQSLENSLIVAAAGQALTDIEIEQNAHKTRLLGIEQEKYDDILSKQDSFEQSSIGSLDDYLSNDSDSLENLESDSAEKIKRIRDDGYSQLETDQDGHERSSKDSLDGYLNSDSDSLENQEIDAAAAIKATRDSNYTQLETDQDSFESRSTGSWKAHREAVQKDINDNPIHFDTIDLGGGVQEGLTVEVGDAVTPIEAEALCVEAGLEFNPDSGNCCASGFKYDPTAFGGCRKKSAVTTTITTGTSPKTDAELDERKLEGGGLDPETAIRIVQKDCRQRGLDYNAVFNQCCQAGTVYFPAAGRCKSPEELQELGKETDIRLTSELIDPENYNVQALFPGNYRAPRIVVEKFCFDRGLLYNPVTNLCCGVDEHYDSETGNCVGIFTYEIVGAANNIAPSNISASLPKQSIGATFKSTGGTGTSSGQQTVVFQIELLDGLVDWITVKQREKGFLGI